MKVKISGSWYAYADRWRNESKSIHFIKEGDSIALCGHGRQRYGKNYGTLSGPADFGSTCEKCCQAINRIAEKRKRTAKRFVELLDKMDDAVQQQIGAVWPAHAREDHTADWWETSGPAMIQDMKDQLRRAR